MHPFCTPDWRWHAARYIVAQVTAPRSPWFDAEVYRAVNYMRALGKRRNARSRVDVALQQAILVHDAADSHPRQELEARRLAGQDEAAIAGRLGLTPEVVAAYAATFFEVRGRRDSIDYIATHVLGADFYRLGPRFEDQRTLILWVGWNFGPLGLELLLYRLGWPRAWSWDDPPDPDLIRTLDMYLAAAMRKHDDKTALKEIRLFNQLNEIEASPGKPAAKAVRRAVRLARGLFPDPEFFVAQCLARRAGKGMEENLAVFGRGLREMFAGAARCAADGQAPLAAFPRPETGGDRTGGPAEETTPDPPGP